MRLVSPSVCRAPGEVVLRRASYTSSEKWVITNMCPARLSQVTPCGGSPLKQNIFEQAFIWRAIRHSSPNTTRNIKLLNSSDFSETPGIYENLSTGPSLRNFWVRQCQLKFVGYLLLTSCDPSVHPCVAPFEHKLVLKKVIFTLLHVYLPTYTIRNFPIEG